MQVHRTAVLAVTLLLSVSITTPAAGQTTGDDGSFESAVEAAREETQAALDVANLASEEGVVDLTPEQWAMGPLAEHLPTSVSELRAYAETLETLEPPEVYQDDIAVHVLGLRAVADALATAADAGAVGDYVAVIEGYEAARNVLADLASDVSPAYFDLAFVSPVRQRFTAFKALTPEDQAYLDGIRSARRSFQARVDRAFADVGPSESFASPAEMMRAFYDAGAGEALPAMEADLQALTPTERFADEHEWLLLHAADNARLDRLIGEAARDGDAVAFWSINNRLELNDELGEDGRIYPELDPAFGDALAPGSALAASLDTSTPIGRNPYGTALFDILRNYAYTDASGIAAGTLFAPATPLEMKLDVLARDADRLSEAWDDFATRIAALDAPPQYADDHARILAYVDEHGSLLRDLLEAGTTADSGTVFPTVEAMRAGFCSASADLSTEIDPAASVYFDPASPVCR